MIILLIHLLLSFITLFSGVALYFYQIKHEKYKNDLYNYRKKIKFKVSELISLSIMSIIPFINLIVLSFILGDIYDYFLSSYVKKFEEVVNEKIKGK